jgi:hypothetical protein
MTGAGQSRPFCFGDDDMTTRILSRPVVRNMVKQLERLGGIAEWTDTGVVVKAPKSGKEAFRAMRGTRGDMLARWPDGLFDENPTT